MNVFVIPEDSRKDKDLLKPLVAAMMAHLGRPRAKVRICEKPVLGGVGEALKTERIREIIDRERGMVDLFLLVVDRDGEPHRRSRIDAIERAMAAELGRGQAFLGENAWQEIEVWVLAGLDLPDEWSWKALREEVHPKEVFFRPLLARRGLLDDNLGRNRLAGEAAANFRSIYSRCPEDVQSLANRIRALLV